MDEMNGVTVIKPEEAQAGDILQLRLYYGITVITGICNNACKHLTEDGVTTEISIRIAPKRSVKFDEDEIWEILRYDYPGR